MKQKLSLILLRYFRFFAKLQLKKNNTAKIIGITGTAGKTSTRNAVHAALKTTGKKIKVSYKANSETGIPLNILGLNPKKYTITEWFKLALMCPMQLLLNWEKYDYYIVEMGIDGPYPPKNMQYLLTIIKPHVSILLNAAPMHSEPFDHLVNVASDQKRAEEITQLIATEKGYITTHLNKDDYAIINFDQKEFISVRKETQANIVGFGRKSESAVQIHEYKLTKNGTYFTFVLQKKHSQTIFIKDQLLPEHFCYTFAATLAVGEALTIPSEYLADSLEKNFKLPPGRSSLFQGFNDSYIIDSSYNSSTRPTLDLLKMLKEIKGQKKYAILGDIRELGEVSQQEHEKVAKMALKSCDTIFLVGPQMKHFALPILKNSKPVYWFTTAYEAAQACKKVLKKDDFVLVKGSQNTLLLEIAVEQLLNNSSDVKYLPRRGSFWDSKRAELLPK